MTDAYVERAMDLARQCEADAAITSLKAAIGDAE